MCAFLQLRAAVQEARVLARLHHPNIVEFVGMCITPPDVCLLFELCELGDLRRLLDNIVRRRHGAYTCFCRRRLCAGCVALCEGVLWLCAVRRTPVHRWTMCVWCVMCDVWCVVCGV